MENVTRNDRKMLLTVLAGALLLMPPAGARAQSAAEKTLQTRAQSLASKRQLDMAVQTWQQILLVNGNNKEALLGIAKADMQQGKTQEARQYLDRLLAAG